MKFIQRIRSWIREVLPHDRFPFGVGLFYVVYELLVMWLFPSNRFDPAGLMLILIGVPIYGWYRGCALNPVFDGDYREWLASTPWTSRQPLPLGPVHLVTQDFVFVLGTTAWCWWHYRHGISYPGTDAPVFALQTLPTLFLVGYALPLMRGLFPAGERGPIAIAAFLLGPLLPLWFAGERTWALLAAGLTVGVLTFGLRRSLARFGEWCDLPSGYTFGLGAGPRTRRASEDDRLGWPYDFLAPASSPSVSIVTATTLGLLAGWWFYCIGRTIELNFLLSIEGLPASMATRPPDHLEEMVRDPALILVGSSCVARLIIYFNGYLPRPTISGLRCFVTPLAALGLFAAASACRSVAVASPLIWYSAALSAAVVILLAGGPGLATWRLTGAHRMLPSSIYSNSQRWQQAGN